ncbi:MAG TPA: zinc-ribbon and DUF3426 domain-containing protein [Aromatoleum sp.]|uniref:zinc-ribbon and DUF3426 domain-containing protein n=1 Tax=Aromatoleum sp. TaxID=2307007 RepID=UPI002B47F992|nr:zinc-ribbon and DUF3426 domain-containing protein [Aromatoleum sp.]HJV25112.1 zinc-ribbon and DUF3426 domain-containing protein [Aromatoleum sp.]
MFARCPACQTVFRVRPEQLRTHAGQVRCGHCLNAFDALENLLEDAASLAMPAHPAEPVHRAPEAPSASAEEPELSAPERAAAAVSAAPAIAPRRVDLDLTSPDPVEPNPPPAKDASEHFFVLEERIAEPQLAEATSPPDLDFDIPETLVPFRRRGVPPPQRPPRQPQTTPSPSFDDFVLEPIEFIEPPAPGSAPPVAEPAGKDGEPRPVPDSGAAQMSRDADQEEPPNSRHLWASEPLDRMEPRLATPPAQQSASPAAEPTALIRGLAGQTDEEREDEPPESEAEATVDDYAPPVLSATKRWLLGLGMGVLTGTLAAQAAYIFRNEIARDWPALRPALQAACARLNCTVTLPRVAAQVSVDASDLQSEPGRPGRYTLSATIRNRAEYAQAYPHLELTLTDARERALARRVLAPTEWAPGADLEHGLAAGREITINLPFEATGLSAAGYRIYVFYP